MLKHLCDNFYLNSIKKDFIVTIQDYFKDLSLHVKLEIKCIHSSKKEKFRKQPVVVLTKNDCSVGHMFRTIFVLSSISKVLQ